MWRPDRGTLRSRAAVVLAGVFVLVNSQVVYAASNSRETADLLAPLNISSSEGLPINGYELGADGDTIVTCAPSSATPYSRFMSANLGERLREIRKRRGLSQHELSQNSGVSLSLIRKLEQGEREDTRLETARQLASALKVPTTRLVAEHAEEPADAETVARWAPFTRLSRHRRGSIRLRKLPRSKAFETPCGRPFLSSHMTAS